MLVRIFIIFFGRESTETGGEVFSGKVYTLARVVVAGEIPFVETG